MPYGDLSICLPADALWVKSGVKVSKGMLEREEHLDPRINVTQHGTRLCAAFDLERGRNGVRHLEAQVLSEAF